MGFRVVAKKEHHSLSPIWHLKHNPLKLKKNQHRNLCTFWCALVGCSMQFLQYNSTAVAVTVGAFTPEQVPRTVSSALHKSYKWSWKQVGNLNPKSCRGLTTDAHSKLVNQTTPTGWQLPMISFVQRCYTREVPQTCTSLRYRSFIVAEMHLWNTLHLHLHDSKLTLLYWSSVGCWNAAVFYRGSWSLINWHFHYITLHCSTLSQANIVTTFHLKWHFSNAMHIFTV